MLPPVRPPPGGIDHLSCFWLYQMYYSFVCFLRILLIGDVHLTISLMLVESEYVVLNGI